MPLKNIVEINIVEMCLITDYLDLSIHSAVLSSPVPKADHDNRLTVKQGKICLRLVGECLILITELSLTRNVILLFQSLNCYQPSLGEENVDPGHKLNIVVSWLRRYLRS